MNRKYLLVASSKANTNAAFINSVEKRERELTKNLETVNKDKEKIEETIAELDRYKRDALEKTWEKVNKYVCSWFLTR